MNRVILHADLNNFYASVECLYQPKLRGKPIAVVGDAELRHGIVLAKNYEAKRFDVKTGDPLWMARQKCRDIQFVPAHFERYLKHSRLARDIYARYTDRVESFGIDECWLDVTGSTKLFGDGVQMADEIRTAMKTELGVTVSVGVSFNKIFAKLGSDLKKPDATTFIPQGSFRQSIWHLPAEELLFVGRATKEKLNKLGVFTIGDLARCPLPILEHRFGKNGRMLHIFANGRDDSPVRCLGARHLIKSIGNSTTAPRDLTSEEEVKITLYALCESVSERLRDHDFRCRTIQVTLRDTSLFSFERQCVLSHPSCATVDIFDAALALYRQHARDKPLRSIGVRATRLIDAGHLQLSLLPSLMHTQKQELLDQTIDSIRDRFGHFSIQRGIMLSDKTLSALNPKEDHVIHPDGYLR